MQYRKHREEELVRSLSIRLPEWLYLKIESLAAQNRRSRGAEIATLLEHHFVKEKVER